MLCHKLWLVDSLNKALRWSGWVREEELFIRRDSAGARRGGIEEKVRSISAGFDRIHDGGLPELWNKQILKDTRSKCRITT